jgi:crotonobetainyl-CoA:carnitine CoA-transferase CaiB-like acyl-CoA transferase
LEGLLPIIYECPLLQTHPTLGRLQTLGSPLKLSATPPVIGRPAPLLGEHTSEVLSEVGYTDAELAELRGAGVIA